MSRLGSAVRTQTCSLEEMGNKATQIIRCRRERFSNPDACRCAVDHPTSQHRINFVEGRDMGQRLVDKSFVAVWAFGFLNDPPRLMVRLAPSLDSKGFFT